MPTEEEKTEKEKISPDLPTNRSKKGMGKKRKSNSRRRMKMTFISDEDGKIKGKSIETLPDIPDPTEQEQKIIDTLTKVFGMADDAAKAVARFEKDVLMPRLRENDEADEEFGTDEFQSICFKLSKIALVKSLLEIYELSDYEDAIVNLFIDKELGDSTQHGQPTYRPSVRVYRGSDSSYLEHMIRTTDNR